jgi:DNA repair photolyase
MAKPFWGRGKDKLEPGEATAHPSGDEGRGARTNMTGRYETQSRVLVDDGWGTLDDEPPKLNTSITVDATRTIITRNKSPDISFDRSINPYRGCEHGCVYCFARPTHAYLGLSPGLDFESRLFVKPKAAELLAQELADPKYRPRVIAIGTNTDPYQPIERQYGIMRQVLEVLAKFKHPVGIVTKSHLITRDIDILSEMAKHNLARVAVSVTTLDRKLARKMEPRASTPERRLDAIKQLSSAGIPTSVMFAPVIPALNDPELETVLETASQMGASQAGFVILRLPLEIKDLFREWLEAHYPDKAKHVISLMREMRGGRDYDPEWGSRMRGFGAYASIISRRFHLAAKRFELRKPFPLYDLTKFERPQVGGQLKLL